MEGTAKGWQVYSATEGHRGSQNGGGGNPFTPYWNLLVSIVSFKTKLDKYPTTFLCILTQRCEPGWACWTSTLHTNSLRAACTFQPLRLWMLSWQTSWIMGRLAKLWMWTFRPSQWTYALGVEFTQIKSVGNGMEIISWLVVTGTFFIFPFSWECHHPNWRTHVFQRVFPQPPTS